MERGLPVFVIAGALLVSGAAAAHHSFALFDREKTETISGTVKEFDWSNPHVWIEIVADNPKGENVVWSIQGGAPAVMARDGWRPSVLKPGDKISLSIHPRKDGSNGGYYADERPLLINGEPLAGKISAPDGNGAENPSHLCAITPERLPPNRLLQNGGEIESYAEVGNYPVDGPETC